MRRFPSLALPACLLLAADLDQVLEGRMPGGLPTGDLPRVRDYVPGADLRRIGIVPGQHQTVYRGQHEEGGWTLEVVRRGESLAGSKTFARADADGLFGQ